VVGIALGLHPVTFPELCVQVQVKVVPVTFEVRVMLVQVLLQMPVRGGLLERSGTGWIATGTASGCPWHPLATGVMVYITVSVVNPVFVITWLMVLPVPPEKPLRFPLEVAVQEKAVPATDEESRMDAVFPEQMV
jgi:hypothetical protein